MIKTGGDTKGYGVRHHIKESNDSEGPLKKERGENQTKKDREKQAA